MTAPELEATIRDGILLTSSALAAGITKGQLAWAVRSGALVRCARGAYTTARTWESADTRARHLLRLRAAQALSPEAVAVAESAAVVWGLPLPRVPDRVRLALPRRTGRDGGGTGGRGHAIGRRTWLPPDQVRTQVTGLRVTTPARTVLDCARHLDRPWTLAVADAARRYRKVTPTRLRQVADGNPCDPAHRAAIWAADLLVDNAESPLESLARATVVLGGHPTPQVQVWLSTARGDVRVDLLDPGGRIVIEADGRLKYDDPESVWQEKLREDAVRATGREVLRFTYADYLNPAPWLARYRAALLRAYGRPDL